MHVLATRQDEPAARLIKHLPSVSPLGLFLVTLATRLAHRVTGHVPHVYRYPYEGEPTMNHQPAARDNTPPTRARIAAFLESCGLSLLEQHNFGQETGSQRALAGFATATVPPLRYAAGPANAT